jgi:trans-2,3-dihydro-3-hydroxyanthranilate isomerase
MTQTSMLLDYHVVDVFTDVAFTGNPLAVVLGADDLTTEQLQALAREFNLSETAFPMAPTSDDADYRLRIFTPAAELPFAGHPSVGCAWLLHDLGRLSTGRAVQECGAGLLPVDVSADGATLTGGAAVVGDEIERVEVCRAVGLDVDDLIGPPPRWAGTGLLFAYVHVRDDAVRRAAPDLARLAELGHGGVSVFSYDDGRAHVRVFAGGVGVPEDPATGSAALGLGVWLVDAGLAAPDGRTTYLVEQGIEMHRPSRLSCAVEASGGQVVSATVSGRVVPVAEGRVTVPVA